MHYITSVLSPYIDPAWLAAGLIFAQVVLIDIVMAGDNALAVGIAASGLTPDKRGRAIVYGLIGAIIVRVAFVFLTVQLFNVVGLLLAGGLLLLWVCMRMLRAVGGNGQTLNAEHHLAKATGVDIPYDATQPRPAAPDKTLIAAVVQIMLADISMSLDNVLAVAGVARHHIPILAFGLLFSIAAMGVAANLIARVLHKYRWIGYIGVLIVFTVAVRMIWHGATEVWQAEQCRQAATCAHDTWQRTHDWWAALFAHAVHH